MEATFHYNSVIGFRVSIRFEEYKSNKVVEDLKTLGMKKGKDLNLLFYFEIEQFLGDHNVTEIM